MTHELLTSDSSPLTIVILVNVKLTEEAYSIFFSSEEERFDEKDQVINLL